MCSSSGLAQHQIRGGISQSLRGRPRGSPIHRPLHRLLQRPQATHGARPTHPRSGLLQPAATPHGSITPAEVLLSEADLLRRQPGPPLIPAGAVIFPKRGGAILTNQKRLALVDMCADLNIMSVIPTDTLTPDFLYMYFLTVTCENLA